MRARIRYQANIPREGPGLRARTRKTRRGPLPDTIAVDSAATSDRTKARVIAVGPR